MRSFDVFDTVLTRVVGDPRQVFRQAASELCDGGTVVADPETMSVLRHTIEHRLFELVGHPPTLVEIHDELAIALGLPPALAGQMLEAELRWERRLSVLVPGIDAQLHAARATGRVVFISDTPLSECFLRELLEQAGAWGDGDAVYSSADRGQSKGGGGALFQIVADDLAVSPVDILHVGDHEWADVAEPRLRGLTAAAAPAGRLNRYERILGEGTVASGGLSSYLAGASRLARLQAKCRGVDVAVAAVAAGVAAPLLVGYGRWVLEQARQQDLDRLYFVARDGEVMLDVTRPLAGALGMDDVELRYLYGSRSAWHLASLHGQDVEDLAYWLHGHRGEPAREVLQRIGTTPERAYELVPDPVLHPASADAPLSAADLARLGELVNRSPLLGEIQAAAAERHGLLLAYLEQEGLGDGARVGVVDVGWLGRSGRSLDDAMHTAGLPSVVSYLHIGLASQGARWATSSTTGRMRAFLFDQVHGSGMAAAPNGIIGLIETFCTGSEGSVSGYRRDPGGVVPVLVRPLHQEAIDWGLHDLRSTIADAVAALVASGAPLDRPGDLREVIDRVLREFWERPTAEEVARWGTFPFEAAQTHLSSAPLAAPVRTGQVVRDLRAGQVKLRPATSWRAGTAELSPPPWRQVLRTWAWLEGHRSRLRRIPHRLRLELALRRDR